MDPKAVLLDTVRAERRRTRATVAAMADGDMAYRPAAEQMDFGTQALHILSAWATLMGALSGRGWVWDQGMTREKYPTQEAILKLYDEESARLYRFLEGLDPEGLGREVETPWGKRAPVFGLLLDWVAHECHHRGQMVAYLRCKGMKPPEY